MTVVILPGQKQFTCAWHVTSTLRRILFVNMVACLITFFTPTFGQEKNLVQVRAFDKALAPVSRVALSINGKEFITLNSSGVGFIELLESELPPQTITVKSQTLEVESWHYSKGVIDVIIRAKDYKVMAIQFLDDNKPLKNVSVTFYGNIVHSGVTNGQGILELNLSLKEKIASKSQFTIKAYQIISMSLQGKHKTIEVEPIKANSGNTTTAFHDFDLKDLDSIQSLTAFYAIFKKYPIASLDETMKKKIDAKFKELVNASANRKSDFIGNISDSSLVDDDIRNLLAQAHAENLTLDQWRKAFDNKITIINKKIENVENLNDAETKKLLHEISELENILAKNERKFYRNLTDYKNILGGLKDHLLDVKNLEKKLFLSEAQRTEQNELFQRGLKTIIMLVIFFSLLAIVFIYFSLELKRKQKQLMVANDSIQQINAGLETTVQERTLSLKQALDEMDLFLYRASHDLRGPIVSILGLCNVAKHASAEECLEIFDRTAQTALKMDRILRRFQLINEISHPQNASAFNLTETIRSIREKFKRTIDEQHVAFSIHAPDVLILTSYPKLVEIIISSLVENALFYTSIKKDIRPEISISITHDDHHVNISVCDNGIGIEENVISSIWKMFYLGNHYSNGNGLGLYITMKSVQALQGNITVQSVQHVSTEFNVTLPIITTRLDK